MQRGIAVGLAILAFLPTLAVGQPGQERDIIILADSHNTRHLFGGLEPVFAKVLPGTTVTWTNHDSVKHTIEVEAESGAGLDTTSEPAFNFTLFAGQSFERVMEDVGNFTVRSRDSPDNVVGRLEVLDKDADTEVPTVAWAVQDGDLVESSIVIVTTDDVDVVRVEVSVDGEPLDDSVPFPYFLDLRKAGVLRGEHTLTATAYDLSGNSAEASVNIRLGDGLLGSTAPGESLILSGLLAAGAILAIGLVGAVVIRSRRRNDWHSPIPGALLDDDWQIVEGDDWADVPEGTGPTQADWIGVDDDGWATLTDGPTEKPGRRTGR